MYFVDLVHVVGLDGLVEFANSVDFVYLVHFADSVYLLDSSQIQYQNEISTKLAYQRPKLLGIISFCHQKQEPLRDILPDRTRSIEFSSGAF